MKRLSDLRPSDLQRVLVWRYVGENDDTASVQATERRELSRRDEATFIAHTQFTLADGSQHVGFCTPAEGSTLESIQPVIVTDAGTFYFWFDPPPSRESWRAQLRLLGVPPDSVFPVHYRCTVPVDGRFVFGTIEEGDLQGTA